MKLSLSVRSSKEEKKACVCDTLRAIADKYGATLALHGDYPGWEYKKESHLREVMCEVFKKRYDREPRVTVIHAGLECGLFTDKIPELDCISAGPDCFDIHTPDKRLSLPSLTRFWEYLLEVLKSI